MEKSDTENKIVIIVTFYFDSGKDPLHRMKKDYVVYNWQDEADLRRILDEIAQEMNHLSGYGIWSISVRRRELKFKVDYKNQFKPYEAEHVMLYFRDYYFHSILRFHVGYYGRGNNEVKLVIPRMNIAIGHPNPTRKYKHGDSLFHIKVRDVGNKRQVKKYDTIYYLEFDKTNPFLVSFLEKISVGGVLMPLNNRDWQLTRKESNILISWWQLPERQTTNSKRKQYEKSEKSKKRVENKIEEALKKAGVVNEKKKRQRADKVYIVHIDDYCLTDIYKIGVSKTPNKRLQSLRTSSPFELNIVHTFVAEPAEEAETQLHAMFEVTRMKGEWFRLNPEQISELKKIIEFKDGEFIKE